MNDNDKIKTYYKNIDGPIMNSCLENDKIRNLLKLSLQTDLFLFKKREKKWKFKNTRQIVSECNKKKKEKLKEVRLNLNNLSRVSSTISTNDVKNINNRFITDMDTLDSIINIADNSEPDTVSETVSDDYLEKYSNY